MKMKIIDLFLKSLLIFIILIVINSCGSTKSSKSSDSMKQGDYLSYRMDLTNLEGDTIPMSSFKNKVLFINIWATWCPPCRKEMPSIQKLSDRLKNTDVQFILISPEESGKLSEFLISNGLQLPVYSISKGLPRVLSDEYIPRTFIVDRFGKIVHKHVGERDWNTAEIYDFISFLASAKVKKK
jgi:thiol-disulfide isomerase/thioredoxin